MIRKVLKNKTYGRLYVYGYSHSNHYGQSMWNCICDCGEKIVVLGNDLKSGHTLSCGCLQKERTSMANLKHGFSKDKKGIYKIWSHMKGRCLNKNDNKYPSYGGRGITVCNQWLDFIYFKKWAMENNYKPGNTIDRIDNDGNYCPSNCQWLSKSEHSIKTNKNRKYKKEVANG